MLRILIVRSKNENEHIASYTTNEIQKYFPVFCEQVITTEDIQAIISTLQSYLALDASHVTLSLTSNE